MRLTEPQKHALALLDRSGEVPLKGNNVTMRTWNAFEERGWIKIMKKAETARLLNAGKKVIAALKEAK